MKKQVHSLWKMTRRTMLACLLLLAVWQPSMAQTALTYGDVAICGWNNNLVSSNRQIQVVLLKACAANTVFKISALGFNNGGTANSASNGRATAGISKWTNNTGSTLPAGTVITILNNGTTISSDVGAMSNIPSSCSCGANGSPVVQSTSGGRFFIYYGGTSDGTGTGQDLTATSTTATFQGTPIQLFGFQGSQTGYTAFLTSTGTTGNFQTYLPSDLASYNVFHSGSAIGGYFTPSRTAGYTAASLRTALQTTSNWSTTTGTGTVSIPSGNFTMATTPTFTGATALTACNAVSTPINSNLAITDAAAAGSVTETWTSLLAPTHGTLGGFSYATASTGGAVTPSGLTYTPTAGYTGSDTFAIQVSNGSVTATKGISVTVAASPNPGTVTVQSGFLDSFCATAFTNLVTSGATGGVWSSAAATTIAPVRQAMPSGGTTTISYTVSTVSCGTQSATKSVYVRPFSDTGSTIVPARGTVLCTGATLLATSNSVTVGLPRYGGVSYGRTWTTQNASIASVNNSTGLITAVSAGTVNITYTTAPNGCGSFNSRRNITVQTTPSAGTVSGTTPLCVSASATYASTGTAGGTWTTSNSSVASVNASTGAVTGVSAGSATISYTVTSGSCGTFMASQAVTVLVAPSAGTVSGTSPLCVGGSTVTYTASGTSGGTWSTSNASVASVTSAGGVVSGVGAGSANITYTVTNSCGSDNANQAVTVNTAGSAGTLSGASSVCAGATTTLSTTGTGGTWSSSNTARATVDASGVVTGLSAGSVTISYTVSGACGAGSATQAMTVNAAASAGTISGATSVCESATTTLSTSGAGGSWSSSNTSIASVNASTGVVYGVAAGSATISYIVSGACGSGSTTSSMTVNPLPNAGTISGTATVCTGATTTLSTTGTGGSWSSSNTARATVNASGVVTGVGAGSVTISYSATNGCGTDVATQAVTVNTTPNAGTISGATSVCVGANTTLTSSGLTGGTWSSSAASTASVNATTGVVHGVAAGAATISYSVTTACGTDVATSSMTVNPLPNAGTISGTPTVCVGATTSLTSSGSTGGSWSSSNTARATVNASGVVTGVSAGSVTISYSVTNSCGTDVATQAVTVNPIPNAGTISGASSVCAGANTTLSTSGSGGSWSSSAASTASVNTSGVVHGVAAGSATISYSATNSCGTDVATQSITVNPLPDAGSVSGATTLCVAATTTLTSSGSTGGTWSSSNTARATVDASTGDVTGVGAGSVTISYAVTNSCGTDVATQSMTISPLPNAGTISGASSVYETSNTSLTSSGTSGGTWSSSATSYATVTSTGLVHGVAAGSATISYAHTNSCGTDVATTSITVDPHTSVGTISGASAVCVSGSTTLTSTVTGGSWSSSVIGRASVDASTGDVTRIASGSVTISYAVTGTCGTGTTTQSMTVNPLPNAGVITGSSTVCESASITLTDGVSGGTWSTSASSTASVSATGVVYGVAAGSATISYTVSNSCGTDVATRSITVNPLPATPGSITGTATIAFTGSTTTLSNATSGGTWSSSNTAILAVNASGVVTAVSAGTATITYTVSNSCGAAYTTRSVTCASTNHAPVFMGGDVVTANVCANVSTFPLNEQLKFKDLDAGQTVTISVVSGPAHGSVSVAYTVTTTGGIIIPSGLTFSPSSTHLGPDSAYVRVTDGIASDTVKVRINVVANPVTPTISGATSMCLGTSTTLTASPAGGYFGSMDGNSTTGSTTGLVTALGGSSSVIYYNGPFSTEGCRTQTRMTMSILNVPSLPTLSGSPTVCPGSSTTLYASIGGGSWVSSNTSIATVTSGGSVTGVAAGVATISYTLSNMCGSTTTNRSISISSPTTLGIISGSPYTCIGSTATLTNTTSGGTWSSTNTSVANISAAGVVNPVSVGMDTIIYSYTNSCGLTASVSRSFRVYPLGIPATLTGPSTVVNGSSITLTTSTPGGTWTTSNAGIASLSVIGMSGSSSRLVTGVSVGTATISYQISSPCAMLTSTRVINVTSSRMNNTAGAATEGDVTVSLFPNPTSGTVAVELSNAEGQTDVIVTDIAGKVILTQTSATPKLNIDLSKVAAGTYFVKVKNAGYTFNEKIIVG